MQHPSPGCGFFSVNSTTAEKSGTQCGGMVEAGMNVINKRTLQFLALVWRFFISRQVSELPFSWPCAELACDPARWPWPTVAEADPETAHLCRNYPKRFR